MFLGKNKIKKLLQRKTLKRTILTKNKSVLYKNQKVILHFVTVLSVPNNIMLQT